MEYGSRERSPRKRKKGPLTSLVCTHPSVCSGGTVFFLLGAGGSLHGRGIKSLLPPHHDDGAPPGGVSAPFVLAPPPPSSSCLGDLDRDPKDDRERLRNDERGRSSYSRS